VRRTNLTQTIKKLYENFTADLGISTSGCLPQQKITLEIDIVVAAYENKAYTYNLKEISGIRFGSLA